MNYHEIVKKLVGSIKPIGKSEVDAERLENLKQLCTLVNNLVTDISDMAFDNRNDKQGSVKGMFDYAKNFLTNTLGIPE